MAAAGLAPCLGDVALVRVVTRECGDRAAAVLEKHLRDKNVAAWVARGVSSWSEGGAGGSGGGASGGEALEGTVATAKALGQADALLDELALLTQHTESYDRFVRFLVEEVRRGVGWGGVGCFAKRLMFVVTTAGTAPAARSFDTVAGLCFSTRGACVCVCAFVSRFIQGAVISRPSLLHPKSYTPFRKKYIFNPKPQITSALR